MEPEESHKPTRYYEIDLLRFLAACSVVIYHYTFQGFIAGSADALRLNPVAFPKLAPFTKYGYLGVELFFIISGYVILLSAQGKTVRQFAISRIIRLYPAFWVACTLTALIEYIGGNLLIVSPLPTALHPTLTQYVFNLTMLHEFFAISPIDGAYWSLTIEIIFYFLVSLLLGYRLIRYLDSCIGIWLIITFIFGVLHLKGAPFEKLFFPDYAPYFIAGMLFYLMQQPQGRTWLRVGYLLGAYFMALHAATTQAKILSEVYHTTFSSIIVAIICTCFFGVFTMVSQRLINLSQFVWLSWLGALTYPIYLLHSNIGFIFFHFFAGQIPNYWLLAAIISFVLLVSYLVNRLVERRYSKPLGQYLEQTLSSF